MVNALYKQYFNLVRVIYLAVVGAIFFYISLGSVSDFQVIAITSLLIIVPIFLLTTEYGLLTLIIIRPIIDTFSGYAVISIQGLELNMNGVLGILVLLWGIWSILREEIPVFTTPAIFPILILSAVWILSIGVAIDASTSISELLRLTSFPLLFVLGYHLTQKNSHYITSVIHAVALSAIVPITVAMYQLLFAGGLSVDNFTNRVFGTFTHPNVLGFYMVIVLSVVGMRHFATKAKYQSVLYPWILSGALLSLLFTYTRGAWLGLVIVAFIAGILRYYKPLGITLLVVSLVFVFGQSIRAVTISAFNYDLAQVPLISRATGQNDESDSINWRLGVLEDMLPLALERPVLGYGIGNFPILRKQTIDDDQTAVEAHNDYLRIFVESGILGLLAYLGLLATLLYRAGFQYAVYPADSWQRQYALTALALIAAFMLMSVSDNLLQATAVVWTLLVVLGSLLGVKHPHIQ